ncbi:TRAP transporter large permease [Psychromonas sp. 14N.309.X.WAT.B.A12]|uniref:TRAP transporter large permease n=1 Tax=Psychromonas sp. 14N.309.X.WAT.B.A12 TaxID=2998322 RepID=UPI0025AFC648|nr:TRAP transporter large permease [Psychromonas sp. 14N.309.X.WAT.B.A12]MDN2663276.1 TRAP transporter large permease [Psychromonas sp. 14N.309.X.WAT.B.A12]
MSILTAVIGFLVMLLLMIMGLPIAVVMAGAGLVGGIAEFGPYFVSTAGSVVWSVLNNPLLTAIPLFILLGELLLRSGIADRMYIAMSAWIGRLPGGLLHSNIGTSALFAATSGSSVATAATVGTVALPSLKERNYCMRKSLGSLAAGGTLGILIPPSVNLLVYGSLTNNSIGQLFLAGFVPGILLTLFFIAYIAISNRNEKIKEDTSISFAEKMELSKNLVPPLVIFGVVMGGIYTGLATATESAALGVVSALFFAYRNNSLSKKFFLECFRQTAQISGMILLIITAAFILNLTISMTGIVDQLTAVVVSFEFSTFTLLLILALFYLLLGMFMDVLSMQVLTIPITYPVIVSLGIDPIWYGIFLVVMCEVALITPPVGMNLFVVHSVRSDDGDIRDVMWGALPYVGIMMLFVLFIILVPKVVLWLPTSV